MGITNAKQRVEIFCCYARKDRHLLDKLKNHLKLWERLQLITLWMDTDISPGTHWQQEIFRRLSSAHIILLLVSPDFLASEYCYSTEMTYAMKRYECREARVIPIILRPCAWEEAPFGKIQALPTNAEPVIGPGWHNQDEAFTDVARGIRQVVETLRQRSQQEDMKDSLGVIGKSEAPRPEVRSPDQSGGDIADVSHTPYIATPTDYSLGKTDLNLPQQDKALSFHQQATHSALKFAPEPQKEAMYNMRPDNIYEEGLIVWDDRQGHYVIQLAANQVNLKRHPSFGSLLPGPYRFNYLAEEGTLLSEEPMPNAPLVASYLSVVPGATHEEQALQLYQKAFCDIFEFSLNDLADNRQGLLSDKQLERLLKMSTSWVWWAAQRMFMELMIIGISFMMMFMMMFSPDMFSPDMKNPIGVWLAATTLLLSGFFLIISSARESSRTQRTRAASLSQKRVEHVEGKISKRVKVVGGGGTASAGPNLAEPTYNYYYDISDLTFRVPKQAHTVLLSNIRYRIYYPPMLGELVGIEPLEVPMR